MLAMTVMCEQVCISDRAHQCFKLQKMFLGFFWGLLLWLFFVVTKFFCASTVIYHVISCWKGIYSADNKWLTKQRQEQLITPHHHHKTPAAVQRLGSSMDTRKNQLMKSLDEGWHTYSTRTWRETLSWLERNTGFHKEFGRFGRADINI